MHVYWDLCYIDLAGIVLDKCITYDEKQDSNGTLYTTEITYIFEFIDDFDEPKLNKWRAFLLERVLRYKPESQLRDVPLVVMNHQLENGNGNVDSSITSAKRPSMVSTAKRPSLVPSTENWGPKVYDKDNHTLTLMVRLNLAWCTQC